jgi:hypothetical protein
MKFIRLLSLASLLCCFHCSSVLACRYNVRDVGFADVDSVPYYLYGYVSQGTPAAITSSFQKISSAALVESNIKFEIINTDQQKNHPAMKYLDIWQITSFPAAVLVSPQGQSLLVPVTKPDQPFEQTLWAALDNIISSPEREEIIQQVSKTFGVVLLIKGAEQEENERVQKAVFVAIETISMQMKMMPKSIAQPPVSIVIEPELFSREKILLWSLGLNTGEIDKPYAAVLYGRARLIGPLLKGEEITETRLINILSVVGADCECGLDRRWILGKMLPVRWDEKIQARAAKALGFDPENPMVKMEISQIIRHSLISSGSQDLDNYPDVSFGYREIVVDFNSAPEDLQNSAARVQNNPLPSPTGAKRAPENVPVADMPSTLRNTAFVLIISLAVVIVVGIAVLVRSKKHD